MQKFCKGGGGLTWGYLKKKEAASLLIFRLSHSWGGRQANLWGGGPSLPAINPALVYNIPIMPALLRH